LLHVAHTHGKLEVNLFFTVISTNHDEYPI
jgi:hypothetical protein